MAADYAKSRGCLAIGPVEVVIEKFGDGVGWPDLDCVRPGTPTCY